MRRLDFAPNSVVYLQFMLDQEVHLTSGIRRLFLSAQGPQLAQFFRLELRLNTIDKHRSRSRSNFADPKAMLIRDDPYANSIHHSN